MAIIDRSTSIGNELIKGTADNDTLRGGLGNDTLYGYDGPDSLAGRGGNDIMYGGNGNDSLWGEDGNNYLDGGDGDDYVQDGAVGDDTLIGGSGNDHLVSFSGSDILTGGPGNDLFSCAHKTGNSFITDYANVNNNRDIVEIVFASIQSTALANGGNDIVFTLENGTVTLQNAATKSIALNDNRGDYTMSKTGLTLSSNFTGTMDAAQYLSTITTINGKSATKTVRITGNRQSNTITGGKGADYLDGGVGHDTLTGGAGKDTFAYAASTGRDVVTDYSAEDLLYVTGGSITKAALTNKDKDVVFNVGNGTVTMKNASAKSIKLKDSRGNYTMTKSGLSLSSNFKGALNSAYYLATITSINGSSAANAVTLYGNAQNNTIKGGKVADKLYGRAGNDKIYGNAGNDYLYGEAGNDTLYGGAGNDTFFYKASTGKDIISDYAKGDLFHVNGTITKTALANKNKNVVFTVGKGTVTIRNAATQIIALKDSRGNYSMSNSGLSLSSNFGGELNAANYLATIKNINGSRATNKVTLYGNEKNNTINGGSVNDKLYGGAGNDKLYGNNGNDYLSGEAGNDTLDGGNGNDKLLGGAGNDKLYGRNGDDVLYGGAGNNTLQGGAGSDIFQYGGGNDVIVDFEYGKDTIRLNSATMSSAKVSGKDVVLNLTNGKKITVKGMANQKISIVDSKGKKRVLSVSSVSQRTIIKKFMKSLDNAATGSAQEALNAAVFYASGGLCADWNTLVNNFVADVAKYGGKGGTATINAWNGTQWVGISQGLHNFLKTYCGIDLTNKDTGALTGKDAGGTIKTAESIVNEGKGFGSPQGWYPELKLNGVTVTLPSKSEFDEIASKNPSISIYSAEWITDALYEKWLSAALKLVENTFGISYNEEDVPSYKHNMKVDFDYTTENWLAKANSTSLTLNMYYWNGTDIYGGKSSGTSEKAGFYFDRTLAHELTHAVMCANLDISLWNSLCNGYGCVIEGLAELVHGIDDERYYDIVYLAQSSNNKILNNALTNSSNYYRYAGGYMLFRYLAKQVAEGRVFNAVSSSAAMASASPAMAASVASLADSSAMFVGSADAQLSSLVSVTTAGSLGSLTTSGMGLISVDTSGNNLVATNGSESNNVLTDKSRNA